MISRCAEKNEELIVRVYEHALSRRAVTVLEVATTLRVSSAAAERALRELEHIKLVEYCAERKAFTATDPEVAQAALVLPIEAIIHEKRRELAAVHRQLDRFSESFRQHRHARRQGVTVTTLHDPREATLRLADAVRRCSTEVITMWPVSSHGTALHREAANLLREAAQRGVRTRALYPHTARSHPTFRVHLQQDLRTGTEVRTSDEVSRFMVLIDREAAFLPSDFDAASGSAVTAVYEPVIVGLLRGICENVWQSAGVYDGTSSPDTALDDVRSAILRMLAAGLKDDVVARRLGISSRTLRRHIAALMEELGSASRFQAGVAAVNAGLLRGESA